ncbi:MAG: hypothetical protein PHG61_03695 [Candidatus Marinimicrobia bacterium]|nr:hypothetical protein [Candidatus Neomarinimicrobiota bacterium]
MSEFEVQARFTIMDKETGKTIERVANTTYNSGNIEPDEQRIIRKSLKRIIAEPHALKTK